MRFTVRNLLIAITVIAVLLGVWMLIPDQCAFRFEADYGENKTSDETIIEKLNEVRGVNSVRISHEYGELSIVGHMSWRRYSRSPTSDIYQALEELGLKNVKGGGFY